MGEFRRWLLKINNPDENMRRNGRNVVVIAVATVCMAVVFIPIQILQQMFDLSLLLTIFLAVIIYIGVIVLARRGLVTLAAVILVSALSLAVLLPSLQQDTLSISPFFLAIAILIASQCLRPWHIWIVLVCELLSLAIVAVLLPTNPLEQPFGYQTLFGGVVLLVVVALISFLGTTSTYNALFKLQQARAQTEAAAEALNQANASLETQIDERTTELAKALRAMELHVAEQARLLREVDQQRTAIRTLSMPIIPVSKSTLVVPLVGEFDQFRLMQLQEQALRALQNSTARNLILDITGVPLVDTMVAQGLVGVVQAARLLGAEVTMVGVRPEVAQAIVGLGLNLSAIHTAIDLQSALS